MGEGGWLGGCGGGLCDGVGGGWFLVYGRVNGMRLGLQRA